MDHARTSEFPKEFDWLKMWTTPLFILPQVTSDGLPARFKRASAPFRESFSLLPLGFKFLDHNISEGDVKGFFFSEGEEAIWERDKVQFNIFRRPAGIF